jgi:hypothetical protein
VVFRAKSCIDFVAFSGDCERVTLASGPAPPSHGPNKQLQVLHQCAQANKSLGYIRRSTIKIKTISVRRTLCIALVRSHLAYASQVWAPQTVDLIKRTERVQRRASNYRLDLPFFCDINYNHRLSRLNLYYLNLLHIVPFHIIP